MPAKNKGIKFGTVIKWIVFATNLAAIILLFSAFLSWRVSPLKTNLFQFIGLGFGAILLINVAYLVLWIVFGKWKLAFISLLALAICYKPILTFFPMNFFPKSVPEGSIKVLTYNVQTFINERSRDAAARPLLEYIAAVDADIVLLQEYFVSRTGQTAISQQEISRILYRYPYYSIVELGGSNRHYIIGLAVFSKFPIEKTHHIDLGSAFNGAAFHTINIDGKRITVVNVHLESNRITPADRQLYSDFFQTDTISLETVAVNIRARLGVAFRTRARQVEIIRNYIDAQDTDGIIIAGDFNDTPISFTYSQMRRGLSDAYTATGFGPGITYHEDFFLFRIDYILHSRNFRAFETRVDRVYYSDHYPLRTFLRFVEEGVEE
jgi:endonuclease/exonuclease/phosphatase family metal-dependent hydrolase